MRIMPSNPPSRSPTACSIVDFPDPDGPSSATISPRRSDALTPRSTSIVTSPCVKLRFRSTSSSATSFITQHLHWVGIGRLVGRIERRKEAEDDHHDHDRGDLQIGRAPCRERVCTSGWFLVAADSLTKKLQTTIMNRQYICTNT